MKKLFAVILLGAFALPSTILAIDLKQAKFTQVINNVQVISATDKSVHGAAVNDIFNLPDVVRTGPDSRAELVAPDDTITRVGANTIFTFDPASRTIDLNQGSLLFHAPHGKGGGTIRTGSATASVLGTTIIATTTPNGGFKLLDLEGQAEVNFLNGQHLSLEPGQMVFILPGGGASPIIIFRLDNETAGSQLVSGFPDPLPSQGLINAEITRQLLMILNNSLEDTGLVVGNNATPGTVKVFALPEPPQELSTSHSPFNNDTSIIGVNHTPNQPLPQDYTPLVASQIESPVPVGSSPGLTFLGITGNPAAGFVGKNIDIDTGLDTPIDLSDYVNDDPVNSNFEIMANGDMRIWQGVNFINEELARPGLDPSEPDTIGLLANGRMLIAPDSTLEADTEVFGLVAGSFGVLDITTDSSFGTTAGQADSSYPDTLLDVSIYNYGGDVDILSDSDLTMEGMNGEYTVDAYGDVDIESEGALTLGVNNSETLLDGGHDVAIDAGGDVDLTAGTDFNAYDAEVYSENGGVDIQAVNDADIEGNSYLYAGNGDLDVITGGGIYIDGSDLEAYTSGSESGGGNVNILGTGYVDIYDSGIDADSDVNISSVGAVSATSDSSSSDNGYLDVEYNEIYSYYGNVNITADGSAYLYGNEIYAGYETSSAYDVNIQSYGSTVDIEDTYISAPGDVNIESSDTLTLNYDGESDYYTVEAGGNVNLTSDNADVDIYGYEVYADYGDVNITSGSYNLESVSSGGDVYIDDAGIYAGYYDAYTEGSYSSTVNITAAGNVGIFDGSEIYAYDDVNITSYGIGEAISEVSGPSVDIEDSSIYAGWDSYDDEPGYYYDGDGGSVTINAYNGDLYFYGDDIEAYSGADSDGDVTVYANGTADVEDTYISGDGNVSIESADTLYVGWNDGYYENNEIDAGGTVYLTSDNADVDIYEYDIYADGSDDYNNGVAIYAGGNVDIEDSSIYAYYGGASITGNGSVYLSDDNIEAGADDTSYADNLVIQSYYSTINIEDSSYLTASGDVDITSGGTVAIVPASTSEGGTAIDIEDSTIYAGYNGDYDGTSYSGGSVNINAYNGDIYLYDDDIEANSGENSSGDVNIYASGSADVEDTYISGDGNVSIESANALYLGWFDEGDEIDAGGTVNLKSDNGDVDIYDYEFYASGGDDYNNGITISAAGSVDIEDCYDIYAYYAGVSITANDGDVYLSGDDIYAGYYNSEYGSDYYGSINLAASGDVQVYSSDLYANDDVNITAGTGFAPSALNEGTGSVDIENTYIYAGWNSYNEESSESSYDGGSVNIHAYNGDVYLYDDDIEAYSGEYSDGDVSITASGSVDLNYVYDLYADGSISIESSDTLTIEDGTDIEADNGDVSLTSDNADVNITDSEVYSDYGNVNISAYGNVYASDAYIAAGYDTSVSGDVIINALNGTADIENSYISAGGGVYIESSDTLTLNSTALNDDYDGDGSDYYEVYAYGGPVSLKSDYGDVDIYGYDIYAYGGDLCINADSTVSGGNVDIENSYFETSGNVNVNATGNVTADYSYFDAYDDGSINVTAGGNIDLYYTDGSSISVNLTAGGYVNDYDSDIDISSLTAMAGTWVSLGADEYVDLYNSSVTANGGDVDITGNSAGVTLDNTIVSAAGNINITAGGGYADYIVASGGRVAPAGVAPAVVPAYVVLAPFTPETFVEPSPITAPVDNVDVENQGIETSGTQDLEANLDAYVYNSTLTSDTGDVMVNSGGTEEIDSSYIEGNGSVYLTAAGSMSFSDSVYENRIYADNGDVDIRSSGSTVDLEDTYIYANGNVNIDSYDTLTVGLTSGNTIEAYDGDVSLTSDTADVGVSSYYIYSDYGNVNISAQGNVALSGGDQIYSGNYTGSGDVNIQALAGTVDIENTYIDAAGNVNVYSYGTLTLGASSGWEIYAGNGGVNLQSLTGDVNIDRYSIYTYGSDVDGNGVTISAAAGSVAMGLNGGNDIEAYNGSININALGSSSTIDLEDTYIYADGDVNVESGGTLTLGNASAWTIESGYGAINLTSDNGDVDIYSDYELDADGSDLNGNGINISALNGNVDIENDYDIYGDYGGVNISAGGNVTLVGDDIYAGYYTDSGDVNITALGTSSTVDIDSTYLDAAGNIYVESTGTLTIQHNSSTSSKMEAYGSTGISLTSENADVDVYDSSLYAYAGDVEITASSTSGAIDLENAYINAYGSADIHSGGMLTLGDSSGDTIYARSGISLISDNASVDIYNSTINGGFDGTVDDLNIVDGSTLTANGSETLDLTGNVSLTAHGLNLYVHAPNGSVDIENTTINPGGSVDISGSTITAAAAQDGSAGSVSILTDGSLYVGAAYSDTLSGDTIVGNNINITGSSITANNGNVSIQNEAYAYSYDTVAFNIENYTTLTYGDIDISSGSTIAANNGNVDIETYSDSSLPYGLYVDSTSTISLNDISIYDSTITAVGGYVNISAGGYLNTGTFDDVKITADSYVSLWGSLGATLDYTTATAGGELSLGSDGSVAAYDISLTSGNGSPDAYDTDINSYDSTIDLQNALITANTGDVNVESLGTLTLNYDGTEYNSTPYDEIQAGGSVNLTSDDADVNVNNYIIYAYGGDININAGQDYISGIARPEIVVPSGSIDLTSSYLEAVGSVNVTAYGLGDVTVADDQIYADGIVNNGDVNITGGGTVSISSSGSVADTGITAAGNVTVNAGTGLTVSGASISANADSGVISLASTSGLTTIENGSSLQAYTLTVNSSDGILLDGTGGGFSGHSATLTASLGSAADDTTGAHSATIQNANLSTMEALNVTAHTVNLNNDNFSSSSSYNFTSFYGGYHINDGNVGGYVNFNNDTLDTTTTIVNTGTAGAANQSNNGGIMLGGSGAGIHVN